MRSCVGFFHIAGFLADDNRQFDFPIRLFRPPGQNYRIIGGLIRFVTLFDPTTGQTYTQEVNTPDYHESFDNPLLIAAPAGTSTAIDGITSRFDVTYTESYDQGVNNVTLDGGFDVNPDNLNSVTAVPSRERRDKKRHSVPEKCTPIPTMTNMQPT